MIKLHDILKITIQDLIKTEFNLYIEKDKEYQYLIRQQGSPLFDQIELIRGYSTKRIKELIFVEAKHNKKRKKQLEQLLADGFDYNGIHYVRFGKSSSQAKDGITVFICEEFFKEMMERSQLGVNIDKCIISKYESYRCLIFSACQLVEEYKMPNIVIVDEFNKILPDQYVRYAIQDKIEIFDKQENKKKIVKKRMIKEGKHDVKISPFDGFGVHTKEVGETFAKYIGVDYTPISYQIRLPFLKGLSVQAPIKEFYKDIKVDEVVDIFGVSHKVEDIDCIWNISMWKASGIFKNAFGNEAWNEYLKRVDKYGYKIGISKYSHHIKDININSRLNFQYLQCLDLFNDKYIKSFKDKDYKYNTLEKDNAGKIIEIAKYTTNLYEKIIKGDKFYTLKFLGINDSEVDSVNSKYEEAILTNENMLKDPVIKNMLRRKLEKAITQAKLGKIYTEGFYHTAVGDIIGYLEYCAGLEPKGCLNYGEFYCDTIPLGKCLSFRSPLVDPSEVNKITIINNEMIEKYFNYFKDQDVCMINMYDLTTPQQGGMDFDGDAVMLCYNKTIVNSKIDKPIVVDMEDKKSTDPVEYNQENIIKYECNSRDNRIGEITNIATSILNQYTEEEKWKKINSDNVSLLRLYQGKEIDFIKVGYRWVISRGLRKYLKKLPYFLLYNYPPKLNVYNNIRKINKKNNVEDRIPYNAYRSPSPLNELCEYVNQWEKKNISWDTSVLNNRDLLVNNDLSLDNEHIIKQIKRIYNEFKVDFQKVFDEDMDYDILIESYRNKLNEISINKELLANYCISVAYRTTSEDKVLCWTLFGDTIIKNLKHNSKDSKQYKIVESNKGNDNAYEFLGKYYQLQEVSSCS